MKWLIMDNLNLKQFKVETDHLLLVPFSLEYADFMYNELDDDITRYTFFDKPETVQGTIEYINYVLWWMDIWCELWVAIIEKSTMQWIGCSWIHNVQSKNPELWIRLKKLAHWKWYAKETLNGLIDWAKNNLKYEYLFYPVDKDNIASRKLVESLWWILQDGITIMRVPSSWRVLNVVDYRIYNQ